MDGQQTRSTAAGELATNDGQNDGKIAAQQYVKGTRGYTADTQIAITCPAISAFVSPLKALYWGGGCCRRVRAHCHGPS